MSETGRTIAAALGLILIGTIACVIAPNIINKTVDLKALHAALKTNSPK